MNTDFTDEQLRAALQTLDPEPGDDSGQTVDELWARLDLHEQRETARRRWPQIVAAACLGAALTVGAAAVADQFRGTTTADSAPQSTMVAPESMADAPVSGSAKGPADAAQEPRLLARDASGVVATKDVQQARDSFVRTIEELGGRITSETVNTDGSDLTGGSPDIAVYPPVPVSPGINVSVEVPAQAYDEAVGAIPALGEIVQFSSSSVDVGAEISDVRARASALRASVATLQDLLGDATSISEVIRLENAITDRQSELDGLIAQQRYLENQVSQARIAVEFITADDAAARYGDQTTAWERFTEALGQAWLWVGWIVLITSPVWIVVLVWWGRWRRRRS